MATRQIRWEDLEGRSRRDFGIVGVAGGSESCLTSSVSFLFMLNGAALRPLSPISRQERQNRSGVLPFIFSGTLKWNLRRRLVSNHTDLLLLVGSEFINHIRNDRWVQFH